MTDQPSQHPDESPQRAENRRRPSEERSRPSDNPNPSTPSPLQTEFEFTLPHGYVDDEGVLHRDGMMRLATAADEIKPLKDPRVQSNESYLTVILLSRVVTSLGTLSDVTPHVIENLFVSDLAHLQDLYERINARNANTVDAVCPECSEEFEVAIEPETNPFPDTAEGEEVGVGNPEE